MYVYVHVCLCVLVTGTPRGHARDSGGSVLAVTQQSPATRRDARQDGARAPHPAGERSRGAGPVCQGWGRLCGADSGRGLRSSSWIMEQGQKTPWEAIFSSRAPRFCSNAGLLDIESVSQPHRVQGTQIHTEDRTRHRKNALLQALTFLDCPRSVLGCDSDLV